MKAFRVFNGRNLSPYLEHLADQEVYALQDEYLKGEISLQVLVKKYNLKIHSSFLWQYLPPITVNKPCLNCGGVMFTEVRRSDKAFNRTYCGTCEHYEVPKTRHSWCMCDYCTEARNKIEPTKYLESCTFTPNEVKYDHPKVRAFLTRSYDLETKVKWRAAGSTYRFEFSENGTVFFGKCISNWDNTEISFVQIKCKKLKSWVLHKNGNVQMSLSAFGKPRLDVCREEYVNVTFL